LIHKGNLERGKFNLKKLKFDNVFTSRGIEIKENDVDVEKFNDNVNEMVIYE
jgi:hypothetical protein